MISLLLICLIVAFKKYLHHHNNNKPSKIEDNEDPMHLDPIFKDKICLDLKLEDPVLNYSIEEKKENDFDHIGSALTNVSGQDAVLSEESMEYKEGFNDMMIKSETLLKKL